MRVLAPGDVEAQVVAGRVDEAGRLCGPDVVRAPLTPAPEPDAEGRWLYGDRSSSTARAPSGTPSAFFPAHRPLCGGAEMGLVAVPSENSAAVSDGTGGVLMR